MNDMTLGDIERFLEQEISLQRIDSSVKAFQRSIPGTERPVFVPVRPRADSIENDCFENVRRQIADEGGGIVHGWLVTTFPGVFLEAIFHAVWRAPGGGLVDVSPPPEDGTGRIVFFPDPTRSFQGEPIPNRHWPLVRMRELREYFRAFDEDSKAWRESAKRNGIGYNEPFDRSDPALAGPRSRLALATLALCKALGPSVRG